MYTRLMKFDFTSNPCIQAFFAQIGCIACPKEGCPVNIDQAESIVRLVKADVCRFVGLILLDVKRGFIGHLDCRCWGRRGGLLGEVILDEHLLSIIVDAGLGSGDEE